jgi:D-alanyl-D-alanine carboxypeptidase (penicillin-binding protein 5/6)
MMGNQFRRRTSLRSGIEIIAIVAWLAAIAPATRVEAAVAAHHRRAAHASSKKATAAKSHQSTPLYKGALLEDADSGRVLYAYNADMQWPPASMAKMMLLLVAAEQVKSGACGMNDQVRISERSAHTGGSRIGLKQGDVHPLGELMKAALVKSANDAAVAVAEKVAGSVEAMVRMMNARAEGLGMSSTAYQTVDGLPPRPTKDADRTNAYDLAAVGRAIIRETKLLDWSSQESVEFDNGVCMLHNTNHLVGHFDGCDGLKTGFTSMAGFNVTATARRGDMRLIVVILGAPSNAQRFEQAGKLMQWGFDHYQAVTLLKSGQTIPVSVQVTAGPELHPVAAHELKVVLPRADAAAVQVVYDVPPTISGPIRLGEPLGRAIAMDHGDVMTEVTTVSPVAVQPVGDELSSNRIY